MGIPEYRYYEPQADMVIEPLNFSPAGEKKTKKLEIDPKLIYPKSEIYKLLKQNGVDSYVFAKSNYKDSEYNIALSSEPENVSYETTADALVKFSNIFRNASKQKRYFYLYFDQLDKISHKYGVGSPELDAEIDLLMYGLEKYLYKNALKGSNITALFMFADHGQVNVSEEKKIYLNQLVPNIEKYLEKSAAGKAITPGGSPRIQFVYAKKDKAQEIKKLLSEKLPVENFVLDLDEMHDRKLIKFSDGYSGRLPELFILPNADTLIWWYEKGKFEINKIGNHGGGNRQEMEIPFLTLNF